MLTLMRLGMVYGDAVVRSIVGNQRQRFRTLAMQYRVQERVEELIAQGYAVAVSGTVYAKDGRCVNIRGACALSSNVISCVNHLNECAEYGVQERGGIGDWRIRFIIAATREGLGHFKEPMVFQLKPCRLGMTWRLAAKA